MEYFELNALNESAFHSFTSEAELITNKKIKYGVISTAILLILYLLYLENRDRNNRPRVVPQ